MTSRRWNGITQTLTYDAENRLTGVSVDGSGAASFVYDGEGNRVKGTVGVTTTLYMGTWYEWSAGAGTSYYYFGGQRVAMRAGGQTSYIHGDHLTSATNTTGGQASDLQRYYPYGETRGSGTVETPYRYTGQREEEGIGLYYYEARWYDPALGRFIQPDTIVPEPGNSQAANRYSYALNNPIKYNDPNGHWVHIVVGAVVGAAIGAGSVAVPRMIENIRQGEPLLTNLDPVTVAKAAGIGAATGAVAAATFGAGMALGSAVAGAVGITSSSAGATALGIGMTAVSGVAAGQAGHITTNVLTNQDIGEGLFQPEEMVIDAVVSVATMGIVTKGNYASLLPKYPSYVKPGQLLRNPADPFNPPGSPDANYNQKALEAYREYIRQHGTIPEPIQVVETKNGLQIVDGHHRWWAAQQMGMRKVPIQLLKRGR